MTEKNLKILGYASISIGVIACLLCLAGIYLFFFALIAGFIGMILSSIYVFIDTRNSINQKKFTAGVLGMLLNSVPVLLMLAVIILMKVRS
jgi:hypothetical protein